MYAKNIRPSVKREIQAERSAKGDDRIALKLASKARDENALTKQVDYFYKLLQPKTICNVAMGPKLANKTSNYKVISFENHV